MEKKRYNIFCRNHKGLYRLVFEAGSQIQKTDFNNMPEINTCVSLLLQAIRYHNYHARKVDFVIYNALVPVAPYIITMMGNANEEILELTNSIESRINDFSHKYSPNCLIDFGIELHSSIFSFTTLVMQQIKREETVLNELLWSNYCDAQLLELEVNIMKQFLPEEKEWFNGQMMKWLQDNEIAGWLDSLLCSGNAEGIDILTKAAKSVLTEKRWQLVTNSTEMQRA